MHATAASTDFRRYLRWMAATLLATVSAVALVNVAIDPLGVFDSPRIAGVNALKPHLDHERELSRWSAARRVCAATAIFGNSRAEIGFDPESAAIAVHGLDAFNLAIPGSGAGSTRHQLAWLQGVGCMPKTLVVGVEFFDFLGTGPAAPRTTSRDEPPALSARFFAESVVSLAGLRDSAQTVLLQRERDPALQTSRGFNPLYNYRAEVAQSGHYVLFRQRAEENARKWGSTPPRIGPADGRPSVDEQDLDHILDRSLDAGSTVYLVIYPYHAEVRLMIERLGLGPLFADWKRLIVSLAARHAARQGGAVQVWDFSGLSPWTLEPIPPQGDRRTQLRYYWEGGHFKKALGDLVLARLLGAPGDFGARLEAPTLDAWLAADHERVREALAVPSPLRSEVDDVLAHVAPK